MAPEAERNNTGISINMSINTRELPVRVKDKVKVWVKAMDPDKVKVTGPDKVKVWGKARCLVKDRAKPKEVGKVVKVKETAV
jgi:predicted amino acid dehydrogenase